MVAKEYTEEQRNLEIAAEAERETEKTRSAIEFAASIIPQGSNALEAPVDPEARYGRSEFIERLDLHYPGWRSDIPEFPVLSAETLIEIAEYCEQIVDELQDAHTADTLHSLFVSLDNQIGTASQLLTENSYLAVLALVNALELFDEDAADHSALITKYKGIAVSCLDTQAQIMRNRAANLPAGATRNEGE
ncbi:hypothetical protein ACC684_28400 [Rhizobium ruizarguesonis]